MVAGKTTLARHLSDKYGYKILPLAQPIKDMEQALASGESPLSVANRFMSEILDPMQLAMLVKILEEAERIPREEPKPRKRLQFIGTDGGRNRIDKNIWIKYTMDLANKYDKIVVDDTRFINEWRQFKDSGWNTIYLSISLDEQLERLHTLYPNFDEQSLVHASEVELEFLESYSHDLIIDVVENDIPTMFNVADLWLCQ